MPIPFPPPGFDDLSTDEKIDYLALLWDRITTPSTTIDVPEWHREVIAERVRDLHSDPDSGDPMGCRPDASSSTTRGEALARSNMARRPPTRFVGRRQIPRDLASSR
jgi:Putative addiction module component